MVSDAKRNRWENAAVFNKEMEEICFKDTRFTAETNCMYLVLFKMTPGKVTVNLKKQYCIIFYQMINEHSFPDRKYLSYENLYAEEFIVF